MKQPEIQGNQIRWQYETKKKMRGEQRDKTRQMVRNKTNRKSSPSKWDEQDVQTENLERRRETAQNYNHPFKFSIQSSSCSCLYDFFFSFKKLMIRIFFHRLFFPVFFSHFRFQTRNGKVCVTSIFRSVSPSVSSLCMNPVLESLYSSILSPSMPKTLFSLFSSLDWKGSRSFVPQEEERVK